MEIITEKPTATAEAESFAAHKAARVAQENPPAEKKEPEQNEADKKAETSKAAEKRDTTETSTSRRADGAGTEKAEEKPGAEGEKKADDKAEPGKKERGKIDPRLRELTERAKKAEDEREQLRLENERLKTAKPADDGKSAAPKPAADADPKPILKEFVDKLKAEETYEDAQEKWADAVYDWRDRQNKKAAAEEKARQERETFHQTIARKEQDARAKYDDWDDATWSDKATGSGLIFTQPMARIAVDHEQGFDVTYYLGKNPEEYRRIKELPHTLQYIELGQIARKLSGQEEKPKPAGQQVSKAPPPPRTVGGSGAPSARDTSEAVSFAEHKRLRQSRS